MPVFTACSSVSCSEDPKCVRVLFIGNSYTYMNNLPIVLSKLADSAGKRLEIEMRAPGGWTLAEHLTSQETIDKIQGSKWNYIVLQEQSIMPANESVRNSQMYPAARKLIKMITDVKAKPLLFVTWGHKDGSPESGLDGYEAMQLAVNYGYLSLGNELHVPLAPVGYAWLLLWRQNPKLNLWQMDGSHPNELGTYLAACIFYSVIFKESPEDLTYHGNLTAEDALTLQQAAKHTVINNMKKWNLP